MLGNSDRASLCDTIGNLNFRALNLNNSWRFLLSKRRYAQDHRVWLIAVEGFLSIDALLASTQTMGRLQCKKPESQKWTEWMKHTMFKNEIFNTNENSKKRLPRCKFYLTWKQNCSQKGLEKHSIELHAARTKTKQLSMSVFPQRNWDTFFGKSV